MSKQLRNILVGVILLVVVTAGTAVAAVPGNPFRLGVLNTINALTRLTGTRAGPMLRITNNGAGTALQLITRAGTPPLSVNSSTKVTNLNADSVDGLDSTQLARSDQTPRYAMVAIGPEEAPTITTSATFVDIADMSVVIDIPNNRMADLITTFSAMVNTCDVMRVRATIDGTAAVPAWTQFQIASGGGADSHAFTFFQKGIGSGPHTVAMQWEGLTTCDHQYMDARSLVVTANIH